MARTPKRPAQPAFSPGPSGQRRRVVRANTARNGSPRVNTRERQPGAAASSSPATPPTPAAPPSQATPPSQAAQTSPEALPSPAAPPSAAAPTTTYAAVVRRGRNLPLPAGVDPRASWTGNTAVAAEGCGAGGAGVPTGAFQPGPAAAERGAPLPGLGSPSVCGVRPRRASPRIRAACTPDATSGGSPPGYPAGFFAAVSAPPGAADLVRPMQTPDTDWSSGTRSGAEEGPVVADGQGGQRPPSAGSSPLNGEIQPVHRGLEAVEERSGPASRCGQDHRGEPAGGGACPASAPAPRQAPSAQPAVGVSGARPPARPSNASARQGTLAEALSLGTRPLLHKINEVSVGVDDLTDSVRDLRIKVEIMARGHERLATAMQSVSGSVAKGFMEVLDVLQRMATAGVAGASSKAGTSQLAQTTARINAVKSAFRLRLADRTAAATSTANVYFNTGRTWVELVDVAEDILGIDRDDVVQWLLKTVQLPGRRDPNVLVSMRICVPILRVKPHLMQAWKQTVLTAFFTGIGVPLEGFTCDLASLWLQDNTYFKSARGLQSMLAALACLLRQMGASDMVSDPATVGGRPVVSCTLGHFALASCFVRSALESKAAPRPRRRVGVGEGIFDLWESEVARTDAVLPMDDKEHDGLRLIDGHDIRRGFVDLRGPGDAQDPDADPGHPGDDAVDPAAAAGGSGAAVGVSGGATAPTGDGGGGATADADDEAEDDSAGVLSDVGGDDQAA